MVKRNFKDHDELESYGGFEYMLECRKMVDERNANKLMHLQYDFIKEQRQGMIENRRFARFALIISMIGTIIAILAFITSDGFDKCYSYFFNG